MLPMQVALVPENEQVGITVSNLTRVAAALQKQVTRDFGPVWEVDGTVDAFASLEDVPLGYWPIIISRDAPDFALGFHSDQEGQPFSLVRFTANWSLTASHECLEMLADPFGDRVVPGFSLREDQGRVSYLVEVCDPCERAPFAYTSNGTWVSDFYTPDFFDPTISRVQLPRFRPKSASVPTGSQCRERRRSSPPQTCRGRSAAVI